MDLRSPFGHRQALRGDTIVEYTIIGGLVLMVCLTSFQLFGTNLNGTLSLLKQDMLSHKQAANDAEQKAKIASAQAQTQAYAQQQVNSGTTNTNASLAANNSSTSTVGANGNTAGYAADILAAAKQGLDSGNLSQDEYDAIVKLANKGHDIAMIQGLLENAYSASKGDSNAFANTQLNFNGQTYSPSQLNTVLSSNITDFGSLKTQVSTLTGVVYNQNLLNSINTNGTQIINSGYAAQQQNQSADSFIQYQDAGIGTDSSATHSDSATICTNGEHLDSGQHCVP